MKTVLFKKALIMKSAIKDFFVKEDGEVNIIAIVVLIAIALILAFIFRKKITELINSLFESIDDKANQAIN